MPKYGVLPAIVIAGITIGCSSSSNSAPAPVNKSVGENQGSGIPRPDLRVKIENHLRNIGLAYTQASTTGPVNGAGDLGNDVNFVSPRDQQPYQIVWRVDTGKIVEGSSNVLLAWESTPDNKGGRYGLMGDCNAVRYFTAEEFESTPKAKPNH